MATSTVPRSALDRAADWPLVRHWLEARYTRRFFSTATLMENLYRGVFPTFDAAQSSVPASRLSSYDNKASADLYRERTRRVYINDYPMMLWLSKFFEGGARTVFDLGGHVGIAYYSYQRFVHYPADLHWQVMDVPAVNDAGKAWAEDNDPSGRLSFTDQAQDADGVDIFFAAGSLQYLDYTLGDLLRRLRALPRHLLLNSVPIHTRDSYFTVQNMGTACCPYRVTAEREFLHDLKSLGYVMKDRWENPHRSCMIPFHPDHSLDRYFGFSFTREN